MQAAVLKQISSCYSSSSADTSAERDDCCGAVLAFQQQLSSIAEEYVTQDKPQTESSSELLQNVSTACASSLGVLCACGRDVLQASLPASVLKECRDTISQVCSGSEELKVDTDSQPMMRYMMQKLYDVSQAFNKSGRSKLLVPIDVALENHFADDKIMKVHLPLMRRGYAAEDAWQAYKDAGEAQACDSAPLTPPSTIVTKDKENKSKGGASASTRTGQTLRRTRSEPLPAAGAALAAKSLAAKARGLHRTASTKRSKHVIRTHHHLVPRMAMPAQVTQKCMPNVPVAKRIKRSSRGRGACPLSVIPDTEKVTREFCWGASADAIKKRLDFHAFEDAPVDHGVLHGVTAEDFALFPAMDLPVIAEQKKTIFTMH